MTRDYVDEILKLIKKEVNNSADPEEITLTFIDALFPKIEASLKIIDNAYGEPSLDKDTAKIYFDRAKRKFLSLRPVNVEPPTTITKDKYNSWLTEERRNKISWNYSDRYWQSLRKKDRAESVINRTKSSSEEILGHLGDPQSSQNFFIKGLVVGEVQSGKTENFNAVINRAIDSGYQLILVFSGIMEDLRLQTQDRIESDIVGWGSVDANGIKWARNDKKGVGKIESFGIHGDNEVQQIEAITSCETDFSSHRLRSSPALNSKKILICKKNVSVLRNLINWLGDMPKNEIQSIPLLVLDDEADNASLNNEGARGREYASKVNGHIRAILAMFDKKSYLGYTASPFANVLADRNDPSERHWPVKHRDEDREFPQVNNLFPDDFIVRLKSPTNYIGAKQLFETVADMPKLPVISVVNDYMNEFPTRLRRGTDEPVENIQSREEWDEKVRDTGQYLGCYNFNEYKRATRAAKRDDNFPKTLPQSLKDAVMCFVLSIAIRETRVTDLRGSNLYEPHNTMLVHTSLFTTWQNDTKELLKNYVDEIKSGLQNHSSDQLNSIFIRFENIWNRFFNDLVFNIKDYVRSEYEDAYMRPVSFEFIKGYLLSAIDGIEVKAINSFTGDELNYQDELPCKYIAVGGNRLSRGFTVRGLSINYFIRSTNYSDTLLQMGRWFGYRPGYLDCCRIFSTQKVIEKFNSTTRCIEELEVEFDKMRDQGRSPKNFLVRVKKHPGVLKITRPSILRRTEVIRWSFQDQLEMTTRFDVSKVKMTQVWNSFKRNISPLFTSIDSKHNNEFLKAKLHGAEILDFLRYPNNFDPTTLNSMIKFIELCQTQGALINWTVAVKLIRQTSNNILHSDKSGLPRDVRLAIRRGPKSTKDNNPHRDLFLNQKEFRATGSSANIMSSPKDMAVSLSKSDIDQAEREFRQLKPENRNKTIPESVYRERIPQTDGTLIIYLFDARHAFNQDCDPPDEEFNNLVKVEGYDLEIPIIGYAIGFPKIEPDPGREYVHGAYNLETEEDEQEETVEFAGDFALPDDDG